MQAVVQTRYGSPDDLRLCDVRVPSIQDDEVLVRVRAASVHPDVWHMVTGRPFVLRLMGAGLTKPKSSIPGTDMAGVVEAVGSDVTVFEKGDEVFGETIVTHQWSNGGAYAEYVAVREDWLALKPPNVTFEQAASVPSSGVIALQNLRGAERLGPERSVLVNGAGGGVGSLALQIAKAHGAYVTAVDSAGKLDMLERLGADEVVDYAHEDFTRRGVTYDLVFDVPGNHSLAECKRALKPDGRYVPIGHEAFGSRGTWLLGIFPTFLSLMLRARFDEQLRGPGTPLPSRQEALATLRTLLSAGDVTPMIDRVYPLRDVAEAFRRMIEDECLGKVILVP